MPPRQVFVALAGIFIVTVFLLRYPLSFSKSSLSLPSVSGPGRSLSSWLYEEESLYVAYLADRQESIRKWGDFNPFRHDTVHMWDFFYPIFQCPHRMERIGILGDGGKWVCGIDRVAKQDKCVIYSVGINGESSFESTLMKRAPNCEIWGYDYSVGSWGPQVQDDPELKDRAHFQPWALSGVDQHDEANNPKLWTLESIMKHNGHTFIDVLKIDAEGAEFDALTSFVAPYARGGLLPVGQLQLEIHAGGDYGNFNFFLKWWESLEAAGLRPFSNEPNLIHLTKPDRQRPDVIEYSFINIRGNHALVNDAFD